MLENAIYSVISPEGCAAILWRDNTKAAEAAKAMKLTANDARELGVIDGVIAEPTGGAHRDHEAISLSVGKTISEALSDLEAIPAEELLQQRLNKFLAMGVYEES
jgi:acetyl-CoA carboxylase carboxyl transferase subunit alpha